MRKRVIEEEGKYFISVRFTFLQDEKESLREEFPFKLEVVKKTSKMDIRKCFLYFVREWQGA